MIAMGNFTCRLKIEVARGPMTMSERLLFEELLSSISARFINISIEQVDEEIRRAMSEVLDFFQVDRFGLLHTFPDKESWMITHYATTADVPPIPAGLVLPRSINPWAYEKLVAKKEVISFSNISELPPEAEVDKRTWIEWGTRSNVIIPVVIGESGGHIISINSVRTHRIWPEEYIPRLRLLGEIFVNALERSRTQKALQESEERLNLAVSGAEAGLWDMDTGTGHVWATPTLRELFGFNPEETLNVKQFLEVICPEDREKVSESIRSSIEKNQFFRLEYSICKPDGSIRCIMSSGRPFSEGPGNPPRLIGMSVDITEHKDVELQLNQSQALLDTLINSTADMIWSVDPMDFGLMTFNSGLSEYFLKNRGMHIKKGMRPEDLFPPGEYVQRWRSFYEKALEQGSYVTDYLVYAGNRTLRLNLNLLKSGEDVFGISVFGQDITEIKKMEKRLRDQLKEIEKLKCRLEKENIYLREEIKREHGFGNIIGSSDSLNYLMFRVKQVAPTVATVLVLGETGTGKGMVANAIHSLSPRKDRPMVIVNCAALPANLVESELFGREKGAFTGAHARQPGRFEVADGSTIFLDEIGELPLELQSKLLRVLQEGEFERLGSPKTVKVDVRVIASTSRDLKQEVAAGRFREDLFYRLNVFPVSIPPLRDRTEDIQELVRFFIDKYSRRFGRRIETITKQDMAALKSYSWPGNIRELEHVIERAVITSEGAKLHIADRFEPLHIQADPNKEMASVERQHIRRVLDDTGWRIEGPKGAAALLKLHPSTLRSRMKKLGIKKP